VKQSIQRPYTDEAAEISNLNNLAQDHFINLWDVGEEPECAPVIGGPVSWKKPSNFAYLSIYHQNNVSEFFVNRSLIPTLEVLEHYPF
jgi:hypothetical protein